MNLCFATHNPGKLREVRAMFPGTGGIQISGLSEMGIEDDPPETHDHFIENAEQKARFVHDMIGGWVVADDSGLSVDVLDGRPGVHSKRYSPEQTDEANIALLLSELGNRRKALRRAHYTCAICVINPSGEMERKVACLFGYIATAPRGTGGFGYDPVFELSDGRTMAELQEQVKNVLSHRGQAFSNLTQIVERLSDRQRDFDRWRRR